MNFDCGPWSVAGYDVRIDFDRSSVRLVAAKDGEDLSALPEAVRHSGDLAWMRLALDASKEHFREIRRLVETAMVDDILLSQQDLALLAVDPAGRPFLGRLLFDMGGVVGRPILDEWLFETIDGDLMRFGGGGRVVHPMELIRSGTLYRWERWLNRQPFRQPVKQIRREIYQPNAEDMDPGTYSRRFSDTCVRWDQARALLEGRGWHRVTKTGAEKHFYRARFTAHVDFRTPASRGFSKYDVVLSRIYFLPLGQQVTNRANPGLSLAEVPAILFSETLRDIGLVAQVASRKSEQY